MKRILIFVLAALFAVIPFTGCAAEEDEPVFVTGDVVEVVPEEDDEEEAPQSFVIPLSELTTSAKFFGTTVEGTYMEIIAFKSGSSYRTAFNTCQICYGSRTAYYKQSGSYLVCQNCGSRYGLSNVGVKSSSYTCCPYPITDSDRTVDGEGISIPYTFLVKCKNLFRTWKLT